MTTPTTAPAPAEGTAQWLTVDEIRDALRVSKMTVYRIIDAGELDAYRFGRSLRVRAVDLDAYMRANKVTPGTLTGTAAM